MKVDLEGQAALIAGRRERFAEAIHAALAANGASVWLSEPNERGPKAAVDLVLEQSGRLDILVFMADHPNVPRQAGEWSTAGGSQSALAAYLDAGADGLAASSSRIVVVGSALGMIPARLDVLGSADAAALFQLVRGLSMQLGPRGVRINALALGAIDHDTAESANPSSDDMQLLSHVPSKAAGRLDDVANAVLFLADPQNTYMTGHILPVDGGWIAGFARDF